MFHTILALMLWLVPAEHHKYHPESVEHVMQRYTVIAHAIADECAPSGDKASEGAEPDYQLALYLLTVARHESSFARSVHEGKRRGDAGRSWGLFQIMVGYHPTDRIKDHPHDWLARDIVGFSPEATERATWTAAWVLRSRIEACEGEPVCTLKAYGGVGPGPMREPTKSRIMARASTYQQLNAQLRELQVGERADTKP